MCLDGRSNYGVTPLCSSGEGGARSDLREFKYRFTHTTSPYGVEEMQLPIPMCQCMVVRALMEYWCEQRGVTRQPRHRTTTSLRTKQCVQALWHACMSLAGCVHASWRGCTGGDQQVTRPRHRGAPTQLCCTKVLHDTTHCTFQFSWFSPDQRLYLLCSQKCCFITHDPVPPAGRAGLL
jgi:hypothetical protein